MDYTLDRVSKIVEQKIKGKNVTPDSNLSDLGLDSLDKAEILIKIEDEFGIEFTEEEMSEVKTVNDLLAIINKKQAK